VKPLREDGGYWDLAVVIGLGVVPAAVLLAYGNLWAAVLLVAALLAAFVTRFVYVWRHLPPTPFERAMTAINNMERHAKAGHYDTPRRDDELDETRTYVAALVDELAAVTAQRDAARTHAAAWRQYCVEQSAHIQYPTDAKRRDA